MITRAKIALLHVVKKQLELDEDAYRDLMFAECGVRSSKDLDDARFAKLMKRFEKLGFKSTSTARITRTKARHSPNDPITEEQKWRIEKNYDELGFDSMSRRNGFNRRQCGLGWPQTVEHGQLVIQGQESMLRRQRLAKATEKVNE